ncbi:hypothetical protein VDG07_04900 [Xanthomonas campestris pv. raphani]|uniref:hypothetical protein n=1 Tax=Xanthomonas campestris TaxID=339 RepID=UPI002B23C204|nr:hypothetical protein [Xanthomonas campestris]MEA9794696.1 hypothetical protein [Xanthomonas campestris pv. raphani]
MVRLTLPMCAKASQQGASMLFVQAMHRQTHLPGSRRSAQALVALRWVRLRLQHCLRPSVPAKTAPLRLQSRRAPVALVPLPVVQRQAPTEAQGSAAIWL